MSCMRVSASEELAALLGKVVLVVPAHAGHLERTAILHRHPDTRASSHFVWLKSLRVLPGPAALIRALRDAVQLVVSSTSRVQSDHTGKPRIFCRFG